MSGPYGLVQGLPQQLQAAATTGNGGILSLRGETARLTIVIQGDGTVSSGAVQIEESYADAPPTGPAPFYTGTWSAINAPVTVTGSGAQQVVHVAGSFWHVRVRISTNIGGGGTVTVWGWGN